MATLSKIVPGVPKKNYIILNLYKLTLYHAIWKVVSRYKKKSLTNIFAKFRSEITTLSVFIEIWIYQVKRKSVGIDVEEIYWKVWFQRLKLSWSSLFSFVFDL